MSTFLFKHAAGSQSGPSSGELLIMYTNYRKLIGVTSVALSLAAVGAAQTITGAVSGTVTDASGAVVSGAAVTVTNTATGVVTNVTTNSAGVYSARFLQIGTYTTSITAPGFQTLTTKPFTLEVGQTAKVDGHLLIGAETQVSVESSLAPILNTEDSTIGTTLTANTIENIPLNGRNWSSLTLFLPGAVSSNPSTFGGSGNQNAIERNQNGGGASQASINGNRAEGNNYLLDGVEINETINNLVGYNPNPDALAEIRVISANAPAEYGNVNGGDILAITKSGTNAFHGSVSAYLENYNLDANTWNHKHVVAGTAFQPRDRYTQSQYSGTFGGPIIKDKLFFFVDYFGTRYHSGNTALATVLSAKMRTGDFSELLNPTIMCSSTNGACSSPNQLIQLYDSLNGNRPYVGNLGVAINSPAAKYLIAHPEYYPLANRAPNANSPVVDNYVANTNSQIRNDQGDVKIDYVLSQKDRFSARWLQGVASDFTSKALAIQFPSGSSYPDKGFALNHIHTFSPAILNEFRAGYTRIRWQQGNPTDTTGAFGLNGNNLIGIPGTQQFSGFSAQNIDGISDANLGNSAGGTNFINNLFVYGDNLTVQHGKHLFKMGAEFIRYQQNNFYPGNDGALGRFDYGQDANGNNVSFTSNPNITSTALPSAKGYAFADFVLDRVAFAGTGSVTGRTGQRQWRSAYFVQDDWKIMPNLTLNLGLRYEYFQPIYEVNNKMANVDLNTGQVLYPGTVPAGAIAGSGVCANRACYDATYNNFMPRVGFSYQPTPKTVIRGGFGITKALEGTGANLRLTYNPPFQGSFEKTGTAPSTTSAGTSFTLEQGFSANPNYSGFYRSMPRDIKPQQTNEYSLTTEYQVNSRSSLSVGYVGELSQHLIQAVSANQLTRPCIINGVVDTNYTDAACIASDPAPFLKLVGQGGFLFETATRGMANFNALETSYRQRVSKGLEYTVNYTYGRAMTNAVGFFGISGINGASPYAQNAYDNAAEYGPVGSDVRHNLNGTAVYAVPFGRGRLYGANVNPLIDEVLGGWKISMTAVVYSGAPVTISGTGVAGTGNRASRPNQVSNYRPSGHSINNWFGGDSTTAASAIRSKYVTPAVGTYGNTRVGSERGPGYQQYDFSAFKDFTIFRENKLGFRVDAFNLFNIASLSAPNNDSTSANFGQITGVRSPQRQIQFSGKYQF